MKSNEDSSRGWIEVVTFSIVTKGESVSFQWSQWLSLADVECSTDERHYVDWKFWASQLIIVFCIFTVLLFSLTGRHSYEWGETNESSKLREATNKGRRILMRGPQNS